jgi:hypothetical protein
MKIITLILLVVLCSCSYKRHNEIIKTSDGKFYRLEMAAANESYHLREIDTAQINKLIK